MKPIIIGLFVASFISLGIAGQAHALPKSCTFQVCLGLSHSSIDAFVDSLKATVADQDQYEALIRKEKELISKADQADKSEVNGILATMGKKAPPEPKEPTRPAYFTESEPVAPTYPSGSIVDDEYIGPSQSEIDSYNTSYSWYLTSHNGWEQRKESSRLAHRKWDFEHADWVISHKAWEDEVAALELLIEEASGRYGELTGDGAEGHGDINEEVVQSQNEIGRLQAQIDLLSKSRDDLVKTINDILGSEPGNDPATEPADTNGKPLAKPNKVDGVGSPTPPVIVRPVRDNKNQIPGSLKNHEDRLEEAIINRDRDNKNIDYNIRKAHEARIKK